MFSSAREARNLRLASKVTIVTIMHLGLLFFSLSQQPIHKICHGIAFSDIKQKYNFIHYILPLVLKYLTKDIGKHLTSIWFAGQLRPKALGSAPKYISKEPCNLGLKP